MLDDENPMYSALLFAAGKSDDGRLEAREVASLQLEASVTVLSACSTAGGTVYSGEGLIGMAWAFLVAGCPTTVATLWPAPSTSSKELMIAFHSALARGASPADALRRAELAVRKDARYRRPFSWAPFVVIGVP
jgi:CHAT domain-containing protein